MVALASLFWQVPTATSFSRLPLAGPAHQVQVTRTGRNAAAVAGARNPIARRRELGALLRGLRAEAGMTVEQVADSLLVSASKISRLETGQRGASLRDIRDLCNLYGVTDPTRRDYLAGLARAGKESAWWQPFDLPYATFLGLEAD